MTRKAGKGAAGDLIKDEELATNMTGRVNNLTITTIGPNRLSLWGAWWRRLRSASRKGAQ